MSVGGQQYTWSSKHCGFFKHMLSSSVPHHCCLKCFIILSLRFLSVISSDWMVSSSAFLSPLIVPFSIHLLVLLSWMITSSFMANSSADFLPFSVTSLVCSSCLAFTSSMWSNMRSIKAGSRDLGFLHRNLSAADPWFPWLWCLILNAVSCNKMSENFSDSPHFEYFLLTAYNSFCSAVGFWVIWTCVLLFDSKIFQLFGETVPAPSDLILWQIP